MSDVASISPTDLRDYAKMRGWTLVLEALRDRLYVLNHPQAGLRQLIVPMDAGRPDYGDAVRVAIERLSELEHRSKPLVEASLLEAGSDTWRFAVSASRQDDEGLPLSYAVLAVKGVETALRAAASSEVQPRPFHPKLNGLEARQLIAAAQMKRSEPGSFVLKVACPIDAIPSNGEEGNQLPFVRRAMVGMSRAIRELVAALEADSLEELIDKAKNGGISPLSANLCDGLAAFKDETRKVNLDLSVEWSARLPEPGAKHLKPMHIQWDYFARIEQVGVALKPHQAPKEQNYVGTVETLNGEVGPDGRRSGEVLLDLLLPEGESVTARTYLNADQYTQADKAHMTEGAYISVKGLLHPGRQPRKLSDLVSFQLIRD